MKKLIVFLVIVLVIGSLRYFGVQSKDKFHHHDELMDKIHHLEAEHPSVEMHFDTSQFIKVHAEIPGLEPFYTQFRTTEIVSFPCQNCHNEPLEILQANGESNTKKAHWNIQLMHAGANVMNCATCHNQDDPNQLKSISGQHISLDESFKLCGQCHSQQYKDWQGGAHGKSIQGWQTPRVIKTCVNCHNPHDPAIKSRWPSRLIKDHFIKNNNH